MTKAIVVFTCGNSNDISTWSNVPYLFTKTLEEKGCTLHRIDISPNRILNRIFNTASFILFKRILKRIDFGEYTNGMNLDKTISSILTANKGKYSEMCINAYNRVADYTWTNYIEEFLESLKKESIIE